MFEFKAPSGASVSIAPSSFKNAFALKNAISKELSTNKIDVDITKLNLNSDIDFSVLLPLLLKIDSSDEVHKALFDCLIHCTYNSNKITPALFEDSKTWEDFYKIAIECIKANIAPFFKGMVSGLNLTKNPKK